MRAHCRNAERASHPEGHLHPAGTEGAHAPEADVHPSSPEVSGTRAMHVQQNVNSFLTAFLVSHDVSVHVASLFLCGMEADTY